MAYTAKILRFQQILFLLRDGKGASMNRMLDHMKQHGLEHNKRTIQRDIEELRTNFRIELVYNKKEDLYRIHHSSEAAVGRMMHLVEMNELVGFANYSMELGQVINNRIHFDEVSHPGLNWLKPLLKTIAEEKQVQLNYFKYQSEESKTYLIQPLMLKAYQGRWYLFSFVPDIKDYRSFALDRIKKLSIADITFESAIHQGAWERFERIIGINYRDELKEERVLLLTDTTQKYYLQSLPWHKTMAVVKETNGMVWFELKVVPNYELKQLILGLSHRIEVLEPQWLRHEIEGELQLAITRYANNKPHDR